MEAGFVIILIVGVVLGFEINSVLGAVLQAVAELQEIRRQLRDIEKAIQAK